MTDTITSFKLGYGGQAVLNGTRVLVTSGNMENSVNPVYTNAYSQPVSTDSRSRVLHADGTVTHTGTIGFDLTTDSLSALKPLVSRGAVFKVGLYDGENGMEMEKCYVTSISMNGSPSGFITASVGFSSAFPASKADGGSANNRDGFTENIIPYWWSGNSYVRDWSFSFNQQVVPKFANKNSYLLQNEGILASSPLYLFIGEIDCSLDFTTFVPLVTDTVSVASSGFRIVGRTNGSSYGFAGQNDLGTYKYSIVSSAIGTNDSAVLTIT